MKGNTTTSLYVPDVLRVTTLRDSSYPILKFHSRSFLNWFRQISVPPYYSYMVFLCHTLRLPVSTDSVWCTRSTSGTSTVWEPTRTLLVIHSPSRKGRSGVDVFVLREVRSKLTTTDSQLVFRSSTVLDLFMFSETRLITDSGVSGSFLSLIDLKSFSSIVRWSPQVHVNTRVLPWNLHSKSRISSKKTLLMVKENY